jgi:hypothetical protein
MRCWAGEDARLFIGEFSCMVVSASLMMNSVVEGPPLDSGRLKGGSGGGLAHGTLARDIPVPVGSLGFTNDSGGEQEADEAKRRQGDENEHENRHKR